MSNRSYWGRVGQNYCWTERNSYRRASFTLPDARGHFSRRTSPRLADEYSDDIVGETGSETDDFENGEKDWVYIDSRRKKFGLSKVLEVDRHMRRPELSWGETIKLWPERFQRMDAENRESDDVLCDTKKKLQRANDEKTYFEDCLKKAEENLRISQKELKKKTDLTEKLEASFYNSEREFEFLQRRVREKDLTITDQNRVINDYKHKLGLQQQALNEARIYSDSTESTKVKSLRDENKHLEKELQDAIMELGEKEREISINTNKWQLKVKEKENETSKLKRDLEKQNTESERKLKESAFETPWKKDVKQEDKRTDMAKREITFKIHKLETDIKSLSKANKNLKMELSCEKENVRRSKNQWHKKETELCRINESQKKELQGLQEKEMFLEQKLQNMNQEKMRLQLDSEACKETVSVKISQEYKSLEGTASKIHKDLERCHQEKKKLQDELTQQRDKTQRLQEEARRQKGDMQQLINSWLREIERLKATNDELTRQINDFSKQKTGFSTPSANDDLRKQLEATNEQLRNALKDSDEKLREKNRLQEDFETYKENIFAENKREYKSIDEIARKTRKDLERCHQEKKKLQDELAQERDKVQSLDEDVRRQKNDLQLQIKSQLREIEMLKATNNKLTRQLDDFSKQKRGYSSPTGNDDLRRQLEATKEQLRNALKDRDEAQTRLSRAMGDRLTDNNPNIADLSDKNRPTKLSERYQELYDNQWTDAFEIIDRNLNNEEKTIASLKTLLTRAMEFCKTEAVRQLKQVEEVFAKGARIPKDMVKPLKDYRKALAEQYGDGLYKDYVRHLSRSHSEEDSLALQVPAFVKECFDICWLMAVQDPPVVLGPDVHRGSSFNKDHYKAYTKSGERVRFTVWPVLLLHEDGPVLCKGVAQGN